MVPKQSQRKHRQSALRNKAGQPPCSARSKLKLTRPLPFQPRSRQPHPALLLAFGRRQHTIPYPIPLLSPPDSPLIHPDDELHVWTRRHPPWSLSWLTSQASAAERPSAQMPVRPAGPWRMIRGSCQPAGSAAARQLCPPDGRAQNGEVRFETRASEPVD